MKARWIAGTVAAVIVLIAGAVFVGVLVGQRSEPHPQSHAQPSTSAAATSESPAPAHETPSAGTNDSSTAAEGVGPGDESPDDRIAAEGDGPVLLFTGWDAPIGRGGVLEGVLDTDLQNAVVATIDAHYRQQHPGAPQTLEGRLREAKFDAGPQVLTFAAVVRGDRYWVRVETAKRHLEVRAPDGQPVPLVKPQE